jgi:TM2 domain-containing membrane protein YozV
VKDKSLAYILWLVCLFGFFGIHRMYLGRWITGIVWLLTFGLLLIGQIIDLFLIPGMVERANRQAGRGRAS